MHLSGPIKLRVTWATGNGHIDKCGSFGAVQWSIYLPSAVNWGSNVGADQKLLKKQCSWAFSISTDCVRGIAAYLSRLMALSVCNVMLTTIVKWRPGGQTQIVPVRYPELQEVARNQKHKSSAEANHVYLSWTKFVQNEGKRTSFNDDSYTEELHRQE